MLRGRSFWKLTGSGNDFVFFDARHGAVSELIDPATIDAICDRRSGVGADGIVLFEQPVEKSELYSIRYFNRDGSLAEFCGNAALCSVRLAQVLAVADASRAERFNFHSSSGVITGGLPRSTDGDPEVSMPMPADTQATYEVTRGPGEQRIGFTRVGVPHLVVLVEDIEAIDVVNRGRELRRHPSLRAGANVNFVQRLNGGWAMRTYERGVEAETLACGSGSVALAKMVSEWELEPRTRAVTIRTRGGRDVTVSWASAGDVPFLRGEGRLVFSGTLES
ncbi:MAG: diaminopimelate epimerase [Gemmatimonadota bacterium]